MAKYVVWDEPWPGMSPDGEEMTCNVRQQMTVEDAIKASRMWLSSRGLPVLGLSDKQLLDEFVVVHWAEVKEL